MHIPGISPDDEVKLPRSITLTEDERRTITELIEKQIQWLKSMQRLGAALPEDYNQCAYLETIKSKMATTEKKLCRIRQCDESESWMWVDGDGRAWPVV